MTTTMPVGFVPLIDAGPLIVAAEMGFDRAEGIALDLRRANSWSALRDMVSFGQVTAAQMLSPRRWGWAAPVQHWPRSRSCLPTVRWFASAKPWPKGCDRLVTPLTLTMPTQQAAL